MSKYLPILIFCILANVVGDNSILRVFGNQTPLLALILPTIMIILQILAAPLQAGFSDFYCRRKSLIVSLSFTSLSLIILVFFKSKDLLTVFPLVLVALMNGIFGNTVPLAWAALADMQKTNLRFSLALTRGAYSVGYMILAVSNLYTITNTFWLFVIAGVFLGVLFAYFMIKSLALKY
jgi:MFS family permease